MGKLFAALLVAAPIAAFGIWAYLQQNRLVETRIDTREVRAQIRHDQFAVDFARAQGRTPDQKVIERIERNEQRLVELESRREADRQTFDEATRAVDAELSKYDRQ